MRVALLAVIVSLGCASGPQCPVQPATSGPPFVWEVTGPSGAIVIQATHQGIGGDGVSAAAWRELDRAELYITEADQPAGHQTADPDVPMPWFQLQTTRLDKLLESGDFETLHRTIGGDRDELAKLKPWVAFMLLGRARYQFSEPSIDASLLERARFKKLRTLFLETWDDQVRYLDAAITPRKLAIAIRDHDQACHLDTRLAAFRSGDDSAFINDIHPGDPVIVRIRYWYAMLRAIADGGHRGFVAIGIGQLLGPYGLLAQFAADGYQVRRL